MKERDPLESLLAKLRVASLRQTLDEELISEYNALKKSNSDEFSLRLLEQEADKRGCIFKYDAVQDAYYLVLDYRYMSPEQLEKTYSYYASENMENELVLLKYEADRRNMNFRFRDGAWKLEK